MESLDVCRFLLVKMFVLKSLHCNPKSLTCYAKLCSANYPPKTGVVII